MLTRSRLSVVSNNHVNHIDQRPKNFEKSLAAAGAFVNQKPSVYTVHKNREELIASKKSYDLARTKAETLEKKIDDFYDTDSDAKGYETFSVSLDVEPKIMISDAKEVVQAHFEAAKISYKIYKLSQKKNPVTRNGNVSPAWKQQVRKRYARQLNRVQETEAALSLRHHEDLAGHYSRLVTALENLKSLQSAASAELKQEKKQ